jgi:hypothetical protein
MPRATIDRTKLHHHNLKSLPEGYVKLRQLSYSEMMQRRDIASKMGWETRQTRKGNSNEETVKALMEAMNRATMEFEFKNCIVEHNLEDANGVLLDFTNPRSYADLDPKIGAEIGKYIDELNQEDDDEDLKESPLAPSFSSDNELETQNGNSGES